MGCGVAAVLREAVEKVHTQLFLQFLGCDMDKCKIVFNFQKFRNLALKKGLILIHFYKRSLDFAFSREAKNLYTFPRKVYFFGKSRLNSTVWRPTLTIRACYNLDGSS